MAAAFAILAAYTISLVGTACVAGAYAINF